MATDSDIYSRFCGNSTLWNDQVLSLDVPKFTDCFQLTVLVWVPCAWLLLSLPGYIYYLAKKPVAYTLPATPISIAKSVGCVLLFVTVALEVWAYDNYGYNCDLDNKLTSAYYVAVVLRFSVFLFLTGFIQYLRIKGIPSSGILFLFWGLAVICDIIPVQDKIFESIDCPGSIIHYIYFILLFIEFILHCFADKRPDAGYQLLGKPQCPDSDASALSNWLFSWFTPVVLQSYKRTIGRDDLWEQTERLKCENVVPEFLKAYRQEKKGNRVVKGTKNRKNGIQNGFVYTEESFLLSSTESKYDGETTTHKSKKKPSLYTTILKKYWHHWLLGATLNTLSMLGSLIQPLVLSGLIDYIERGKSRGDPVWHGYALAFAMPLLGEIDSLFYTSSMHILMSLGLQIKSALIGAIYEKALTMSNKSKKNYTIGEIVNLMSVDCLRIQDAFLFSYNIMMFPVCMIVGIAELWAVIGISTVASIAVIIIIGLINGLFGKLQENYQQKALFLKGNRIKLLNEVLNGIKVLKMYAWENVFTEKITKIRRAEMRLLSKIAVVSALSILFSVHSPFMMHYFLILAYIMTSSQFFDPQKAFVTLSLVNILRYPLTVLPFVITGVIQAYVSIGRIQDYLWKEDLDTNNKTIVESSEYAVKVTNASFTWDPESPIVTLKDINLNIPDGQLIAVVGQVGAGKSSIISAILGEMEKISGHVQLKGSIAYVPQEAWIQNMTVRDNILYGMPYIEKKYQKVIDACALTTDLKILSGGDMTEIGEKGINISGGQKQRVSLARAVYNNADIYLLDDPLSAVDSHVGKHLFKNVIGPDGMLRKKTRILVTHGVHWIPKADFVLVMENGKISESGTYHELLLRKGAFAEFLKTFLLENDDSSDESDPEVQEIKDAIWEQVEQITSDGMSDIERLHKDGMPRRQSMRRLSIHRSNSTTQRQFSRQLSKSFKEENDIDKYTTGQLIQEEVSKEGAIKFSVICSYIKAMGVFATLLSVMFMSMFQGLNVYGNFWLTYWTEDEILKNQSLSNTTQYSDTNIYYLIVWSILGIVQGVCLTLFALIALLRIVQASGKLHSSMLKCIIRSPMSFFDTTPVGRMMNRFSSDIDILDDRMPRVFRLWASMFFTLIGILVVISISTPEFLIAIVPVGILYVIILRFYLPTARQLKRIESTTRSPVFNHFSETITGSSVIRAYQSSERFIQESRRRVDVNSAFFYAANTAARWIGIRVEFLGNLLVLAAALFAVFSSTLNGAQLGISLTYSMQIIIALNLLIQSVSDMEMNIVAVERVDEYTHLTPEAEWVSAYCRPPTGWPNIGKIQFLNYTTRYREGLDLVLRGIDCEIKSGEKVGIVGRTGAGKSSLTLSLFRLIEAAGGSIVIDGIKISDIGLHDLRSRITILPQDPVLFSGTLKMNLDPLGKNTDYGIWNALNYAHLKSFVEDQPQKLSYEISEGGQNLSVGQRQLVCLARTLLYKTNVLILDEATAAVDMETDELIQHTIRTQFSDCTVICIAHRLNTIMDYDRIMVLDKGLIVEYDSPKTLLEDTRGVFHGMAKDAGLI